MSTDNFALDFDFKVLCSSKRIIEGIATLPTLDRQKEIILKSAIAASLEGFMELPILHVMHQERPIGIVTKAEVRPEGLYIRATLKQHGTDDVWDKIVKGEYGKFSIYGRRTEYSPECRLPSTIRSEVSPCITKSMHFDSISVVSNVSAVNSDTWLTVAKAIVEDRENYLSPDRSKGTVIQNDSVQNRGTEMVDELETPVTPSVETPVSEPEPEIVQKADPMDEFRLLLTEVKDLLVVQKAETPVVQKAELETPDLETIVKARVATEVETIRKAFDDKVAELTARIEKMENETIKKGGSVVVIKDEYDTANASFGNASALRMFDEAK